MEDFKQTLKKFVFHFLYVVIAIIVAGPPVLWATDNTPPVRFVQVTAITDTVTPGDVLTIQETMDRIRYCPSSIEQYIIDGKQIKRELPSLDIPPSPITFRDVTLNRVTIPKTAVPGPSIYKSIVHFRCNPWQRFIWPLTVQFPDVIFTIS